MSELTCRELVEVVTDYVEGRLSGPDRRRFEAHLETCEGCRNYLQQMQETIRLTGVLREEHVPPEAHAELRRAFRAWRSG
jgi:anti-sigma factor RsiW